MTVNDEPAVFQVKHGLNPDTGEAARWAWADLAIHVDLVVHSKWPEAVSHVNVSECLSWPGAVVEESVVGHHGVLDVSA